MSGGQTKFPFINGRRGIPDWVWAIVLAIATGAISVYATGVRNGERIDAEQTARKAADETEIQAREGADKTLAEQIAATAEAVQRLTETVRLLDQRVAANESAGRTHREDRSLHMPLSEKLNMFETKPAAEAHKAETLRVMSRIEAALAEQRVEQRAIREDIKTILRAKNE